MILELLNLHNIDYAFNGREAIDKIKEKSINFIT